MFLTRRSLERQSGWHWHRLLVLSASSAVCLLTMCGCAAVTGIMEGTDSGATSETVPAGSARAEPSEASASVAADEDPKGAEPSGPQPGTAESTEPPSAEAIDGCDDSICSVSDAVTYEHLYRGSVTVVLFADFSKEEYGECKVAVLGSDGDTAQIFPLDFTSAWSMTEGELTNIFYFLNPATDATKSVFFRIPGMDGWSASGLRPVSTGNFELFDLSYVSEDFSEIFNSRPMTSLAWGELDENGNYELEIEDAVARWDGQKYSAP